MKSKTTFGFLYDTARVDTGVDSI